MELHGATESAALQVIRDKVRHNTRLVLEDARRQRLPPRQAAMALAEARVRQAMGYRRHSLFSSAPGYL
jgi:glutamate dehydrogenase (NAD(P)+)